MRKLSPTVAAVAASLALVAGAGAAHIRTKLTTAWFLAE